MYVIWGLSECFIILTCMFMCCLYLSQQTRSLLSVFEEDSGMLTNYTNQLLQALQRVFGAQVGNLEQKWGANVPTQVVFPSGPCLFPTLCTSVITVKVLSPRLSKYPVIYKCWSAIICVGNILSAALSNVWVTAVMQYDVRPFPNQ